MNEILTPKKTDLGWVIQVPPEMAQGMGVAEGSLAVLHPKPSGLDVEILPPPSQELKESVRRVHDKYREAFEEMKRLGD